MNDPGTQKQDVSWPKLSSFAAVIVGSLWLLSHNVFYTEGEVMQGVFTLAVFLVAAFFLLGFYSRNAAFWCITAVGGSLLIWQTYQTRKWAIIHEDIIPAVRFAEDSMRNTGRYPGSLDGYIFKDARVKKHIYGVTSDETNGFRLTYFMNNPGITYWYSSRSGFGYYPD